MEENLSPEEAQPRAMSRKQYWVILLVILVIGIAWSVFSPAGKREQPATVGGSTIPVSVQYPSLGTRVSIILYGQREAVDRALGMIRDSFLEVERAASLFNPGSELSKLNAGAVIEPFKCSDILWEILSEAREMHELSDGAFDISAKPLMDLWGFYRKRGDKPPTEAEIKAAVELVGLEKVVFDDAKKTVYFPKPGMAFDLGGIAKGYAVDQAAEAVMALGIRQGIIDLGGNIRVLPEPPPGKDAYSIGIRNPGRTSEVLEEQLKLLDNSVATSGNYERYVILKGKKYAHIIDPDSGWPVPGNEGVTVITPTALDADTLSTTCFIKGSDWCEANKARLPADTTVFFYDEKGIRRTVRTAAR